MCVGILDQGNGPMNDVFQGGSVCVEEGRESEMVMLEGERGWINFCACGCA